MVLTCLWHNIKNVFTSYTHTRTHTNIAYNSPIILLTENLRCFTGRPFESFNKRSNALYSAGVFSATLTSQKPMPCDAANEAPSVSATFKKKIIYIKNQLLANKKKHFAQNIFFSLYLVQ